MHALLSHMQIMDHYGAIGFLASGLVLAAFGMKDIINLRIVAICSNFAFIAYGLAVSLPPVWLLHVILLPLNGWRLVQAWQASRSTTRFEDHATSILVRVFTR